jgi:periplasmic copper chaperone A
MNRRSFLSVAVGIGVSASLVLAACGDDSDDGSSASSDPITIEGAWARTSPMMAGAGAAYLTITSSVDDALLSAKAPDSVAGTTQVHETVMSESMDSMDGMDGMSETTMAGMDGMSETTMAGMDGMDDSSDDTMAPVMQMQEVDRIDLPAGTAVALAPGGYHVMLLDLVKPLELGDTFTLTLTFEKAGTREVTVTVRDDAP